MTKTNEDRENNIDEAIQKIQNGLAVAIKSKEACGRAPNRRRIRSFAQLILTQGSSDQHLGQHWVDRFFERNEEVKIKVSRGFHATGVYPTNVERVLEGVVNPKRSPSTLEPPTTLKRPRIKENQLWYTPQSSKDIRGQLDTVREDLDHAERGLRTIARKAGKELDHKNAIASKKPLGRKAVDFDPNETFARLPDITKAKDEAIASRARYATR
ncbi:hypothetical protein PT974_07410 [Cladobotryum mycophilum]|uniref:HTH CENPB-type domain-containing protein n=1 Tax=Cladobotryum mycophilum TaxID=491253 RepID=A0ABR0SP71_9HYPO